jgi:hypothetical protein
MCVQNQSLHDQETYAAVSSSHIEFRTVKERMILDIKISRGIKNIYSLQP